MHTIYYCSIKLDRQNTIQKFQELIDEFQSKLTKKYKSEKYNQLLSSFNTINILFDKLEILKEKIKSTNYTIQGTLDYYDFVSLKDSTVYSNPFSFNVAFEQLNNIITKNSNYPNSKNPNDLISIFEESQLEIMETLNKSKDPIPAICLTVAKREEFEFLDEFRSLSNIHTNAQKELERLIRAEFTSSEPIKSFKKLAHSLEIKIEKMYDQQNVIDNLLNGHSYVKFLIKRDLNSLNLYLVMKGSTREIPEFKSKSIYLPFIKGGTIQDYLKYEELKHLKIESFENKKIILNVKESLDSLEKNPVTHFKRELKELPSIKEFKKNYYTILNFLNENYKNKPTTNIILLNFNFANKIIFIEKIYNNNLNNNYKNNLFYLSSNYQEQQKLYELLKLHNNSINPELMLKSALNIKQMLEYIETYNNIKHF